MLPPEQVRPLSRSGADLYLPPAGGPGRADATAPLVVLVPDGRPAAAGAHGPAPADRAARLTRCGVAVAVVRLPAGRVASAPRDALVWSAVHGLRREPAVDGDRVALCLFGDGGLLLGRWLDDRPRWLRAVALIDPLLRPPAGEPVAVPEPAAAVRRAVGLPILVAVSDRQPGDTVAAKTVGEFLTEARACGAQPEVVADGSVLDRVARQVCAEPAVPYQRLAAYALLRRGAGPGEVLLTRISPRGFNPGTWTLPGGGVEHGEDVRHGLAREVREETGLSVRVDALRDVHSVHFTGRSPATGRLEDFHGVHLIFDVTPLRSDQRPTVVEADGTTDAVAWVRVEQVRAGALPVFDVVRHALGLPTG